LKAFGEIVKGKIVFNNKAKFLNDVAEFNDGTIIVISINEAKDVRTNQQNKLWWAWMQIIGDTIGYSKNETHDIMKYKFLLREETIEGETHQYIKSTTTLSKEDFNKIAQDVFFWANDTLNIKLPNE
jgi:hypothetical protein